MNVSFTAAEPQEYEITMVIGGNSVAMIATVSEVQAEADIWADDDFQVTWERANVAFAPIGQDEPIWQLEIFPGDLDLVKNLTDAQISDICDEIANEAFHEQSREGVI